MGNDLDRLGHIPGTKTGGYMDTLFNNHTPKLDARAQVAYGQNSFIGKILEIHQEMPGRIHVVLIRQPVGF